MGTQTSKDTMYTKLQESQGDFQIPRKESSFDIRNFLFSQRRFVFSQSHYIQMGKGVAAVVEHPKAKFHLGTFSAPPPLCLVRFSFTRTRALLRSFAAPRQAHFHHRSLTGARVRCGGFHRATCTRTRRKGLLGRWASSFLAACSSTKTRVCSRGTSLFCFCACGGLQEGQGNSAHLQCDQNLISRTLQDNGTAKDVVGGVQGQVHRQNLVQGHGACGQEEERVHVQRLPAKRRVLKHHSHGTAQRNPVCKLLPL